MTTYLSDIDYESAPNNLGGGFQRYVEQGIEPGSFMQAVLENNLRESFGRADIHNRLALFSIVSWCYNNLPNTCWGSPERVKTWMEERRRDQ